VQPDETGRLLTLLVVALVAAVALVGSVRYGDARADRAAIVERMDALQWRVNAHEARERAIDETLSDLEWAIHSGEPMRVAWDVIPDSTLDDMAGVAAMHCSRLEPCRLAWNTPLGHGVAPEAP
tara:strand:- start:882 stop:1253 length:372 start_codon:yes stop_codon:yes gene_type:complete